MRRVLGGVAALLAASLLTACAIEPGEVQVKERPVNGVVANPETKPNLSRPTHVDDPVKLVELFLDAAADDQTTREATLRSYLLKDEAWTPGSVINLLHTISIDSVVQSDGTKVRVRVQHVGLFNSGQGTIEPSAKGEETIEFLAVNVPGQGYRLRAPRAELLLSDRNFLGNFDTRPIYFWDTTNRTLVPDVRYVPKYWSETTKASTLVAWLYQGPVSWLDATVTKLPQATKPTDHVTVGEDRGVVVNLPTPPGSPEELRRVGAQLTKTLVSPSLSQLQLKVQGQLVETFRPGSEERPAPNRYAVVKGVVYRLRPPSGPENTQSVRLSAEVNKNVALAAFARGESVAMVVNDTADGPRLSVVANGSQVLPVSLPDLPRPHNIAQPFWLNGLTTTGLVLADETLFQITSDGKAAKVSQVAGLTAMAVSPDGHRIAMVVNGQLVMAALIYNEKGVISLGQVDAAVPTVLSVVHSVAFGTPWHLVVAGRDDRGGRLLTMNLDGAAQVLGSGPALASNVFRLVSDGVSDNALYEAAGLGSSQYGFSGPEELAAKVVLTGAPPAPILNTDVHAPSYEG